MVCLGKMDAWLLALQRQSHSALKGGDADTLATAADEVAALRALAKRQQALALQHLTGAAGVDVFAELEALSKSLLGTVTATRDTAPEPVEFTPPTIDEPAQQQPPAIIPSSLLFPDAAGASTAATPTTTAGGLSVPSPSTLNIAQQRRFKYSAEHLAVPKRK